MGTIERPGSNGHSNPAGPPLLDQVPGQQPGERQPLPPADVGSSPCAEVLPALPSADGAPCIDGPCIDVLSDVLGDVLGDAALAALIASGPYAGQAFPETPDAECARQLSVPEDPQCWPSDEDIDRLVASMPQDLWQEDRQLPGGQPAGSTSGRPPFPFLLAEPPLADPGQYDPAASLLEGVLDLGRVRMIRASVPDLPAAPRPDNPQELVWSPVAGADALAGLDPENLGENDLLDYIHAASRLSAFGRAMEDAALAVFANRRPPLAGEEPSTPSAELAQSAHRSRYASAEIMAVHCVGIGTARRLLDNAETLADNLPGTTAQYRQGLLDSIRIKAILAGVENVPASVQTLIEPLFLPDAARTNPGALTRKIRKLAEKYNPEPLPVRHRRARTGRRVWFTPLPDGMAQICAVLDAVPAKALYDSLESWARQAQRDGAEPGGEPSTGTTPTGRPSRSLENYLADCFLDLIHQAFDHPAGNCLECGTDGHAVPESWSSPRIPAKVSVVVPALTLLSKSDSLDAEESGYLEGYGPIPAGQARDLAAGSYWWERMLTDPISRVRLSVGRKRYHPPADIAAEVRRRDPVCTGIGCDHPAATCELDHTVPFWMNRYGPDGTLLPKGETSVDNLRPRDPYCHKIKDLPGTGWTVEPHGPGQSKTTTPTGRVYIATQVEEPCPF